MIHFRQQFELLKEIGNPIKKQREEEETIEKQKLCMRERESEGSF